MQMRKMVGLMIFARHCMMRVLNATSTYLHLKTIMRYVLFRQSIAFNIE